LTKIRFTIYHLTKYEYFIHKKQNWKGEKEMRKISILMLVMFVLATGAALAQEAIDSFFDFEVNVGFPVHWSNGRMKVADDIGKSKAYWMVEALQDAYDKTVTASTSIGLAATFNFSPKMAVMIDADFFYGAQLTGIGGGLTDSSAYHNALFGFDIFIGPQFYLYNKGQLRIPLFIGPHLYFFAGDQWNDASPYKVTDFQAGLALGLGVQFHFDKNIYIFSRTNVAFDFFRMVSIENRLDDTNPDTGEAVPAGTVSRNTGAALGWLVKPSIGVGIKF
jgi:hypothetical protein